jgi:putative alpha-1,2-mannosidase
VGNEDCGQMSAWNVFSSLGFYPVYPASGVYVIGSPSVDRGIIKTSSGNDFIVEAINNSPENIYVQKIELNGKAYTKSYLLHKDLMKGGTIKMFMSNKPNYNFGKLKADRP